MKLIEDQRIVSENIANEANSAFENGKYEEAEELFLKAASYGFHSYKARLDVCKMQIEKSSRLSLSIAEYLSTVKLASIAAFANCLKKRNNIIPITIDDVPCIVTKIMDGLPELKASERKNWLNRQKWTSIEKELKKGITDAIFEGVKNLLT